MPHKKDDPVVVTTSHRGVFFGYIVQLNGNTVTLRAMRNCLYWTASIKGVVGLSLEGPVEGCRVGPACPEAQLFDVTAIMSVTPKAVDRWEQAPWC